MISTREHRWNDGGAMPMLVTAAKRSRAERGNAKLLTGGQSGHGAREAAKPHSAALTPSAS